MKFNKLLIGLAAIAPFTLASCNNAMSYENLKVWISKHYIHEEATDPKDNPPAIATFYWDFHATTSDGPGMQVVNDIFTKLESLAESLGITKGVIHPPKDNNPTGEEKNVGIVNHIKPLNIKELEDLNPGTEYEGHFGKRRLNDDGSWDGHSYKETFKVYDNALTVSSTEEFDTQAAGSKKIDVTCTYVYNTEGYLAGYAFKIGRYYINSNNIVKFKVTLELEYSH